MKPRTEEELKKALRKITRREDGGAHEDLTRSALARLALRLMQERDAIMQIYVDELHHG